MLRAAAAARMGTGARSGCRNSRVRVCAGRSRWVQAIGAAIGPHGASHRHEAVGAEALHRLCSRRCSCWWRLKRFRCRR